MAIIKNSARTGFSLEKKNHTFECYIFDEKKSRIIIGMFSDPDPLFHETDPRIRIQKRIKMKRISNTD